MTNQKDNYVSPRARRDGSSLGPSRPACEGDEDVLANIARRHASRLGLGQKVWIQADAPPVANKVEPSAVVSPAEPIVTSETEPPAPELIDLCETRPGEVFYVRQAIRKSQYKPARGEVARGKLARGKPARVLIVYLLSTTVLTGLAVVMYFLTR